ncbi:MAG: hypothetical protein LC107_10615 [Chitinophagales bacterium]|nr:hypothetical protein [Chitinophagales bacterium]
MKNIVTIILALGLSSFAFGQKKVVRTCTSMLEQAPMTEIVEVTHYIYTGLDTTGLHVKIEKINVTEARKELVKRKKKDCTAPNPEDCMVEVEIDIPAVAMNLYTLSGPDVTPDFEVRIEKVERVVKEGGLVETSIVCTKNRTKDLIKKVQEALILEGYPLTVNGELDQATMLSIKDYQIQHRMPAGDLTLEVVGALNIK